MHYSVQLTCQGKKKKKEVLQLVQPLTHPPPRPFFYFVSQPLSCAHCLPADVRLTCSHCACRCRSLRSGRGWWGRRSTRGGRAPWRHSRTRPRTSPPPTPGTERPSPPGSARRRRSAACSSRPTSCSRCACTRPPAPGSRSGAAASGASR